MRKLAAAVVASSFALTPLARAASQAELDVIRDKAAAWLVRSQQPDGHWGTKTGLDVATTSAVIEALIDSGYTKLPQLAQGVAWLQNAEANSTDALARQILALKKAGSNVAADRLVAQLLARRNTDDKGWGAYPGYQASIPDTPIAMLALKASGVSMADSATLASAFEGASFVPGAGVTGQRLWLHRMSSNGGSTREGVGEFMVPTALSVLALKSQNLSATAIAEAVTFLKTRQGTSGVNQGAFLGNDGQSTAMDTALGAAAIAATSASGRADSVVQSALDYLKRTQSTAGDWGDAFSTALALQQIGTASTVMTDTDQDGMPDGLEAYLGLDPNAADGKALAATGSSPNQTAGDGAQSLTFSGVRGALLNFNLPVSDAATCCTVSSGSLPTGMTLTASGSPAVVKLTGTPTEVGSFSARYTYKTSSGLDKVLQLRVEIEPTLFRTDTDSYNLAALFASDAGLNKLKGGWQLLAGDFSGDGRQDFLAYFNGANEAFNRLNCSPCTPYAGPDWGQLVGFQDFNGALARVNPLIASGVKFTGDTKNVMVIDFNNDGKKDVVLNLNRVTTTSADPADKSTLPFRSIVLLRNDTPAGGALTFTDVTSTLKLDTAPEGDVVVVDANRDGVPDFVVSNGASAAKLYIYNATLAQYEDKSATSGLGVLRQPVGLSMGGDASRLIDIASLDGTSGLSFWRSNGNGTFTSVANETSLSALVGKRVNRIVVADLNGDAEQELVLFETATQGSGSTEAYAGSRVTVLNNAGLNASQQPRFTVRSDSQLSTISNLADAVNRGGMVADVDDDGRPDIVVSAKDASGTQLENAIYRQGVDGLFTRLTAETGFTAGVTAHDSPIYLDLDGDGKSDLMWPNSGNTAFRLINEGNLHHAIDVVLQGKASNRSALGAQVKVTSGGASQFQQVQARHAASPALHFGLGQSLSATVMVKWPDGTSQSVDVTSVDRVVTIKQP